MKKHILLLGFAGVLMFLSVNLAAQVSINTDGSAPDGSAMLDVKSLMKGLLAPRMTSAEMVAISLPATGLLVFNTDDKAFYNYTGTAWTRLVAGSSNVLQDANGDTRVLVEKNPDEDIIRFDLGGTEKMVLTGNRLELPNLFGNIYLGSFAGQANTTGFWNVGVGYEALSSNTFGGENTAVGTFALRENTEAYYNTAVGSRAMRNTTTGGGNCAFGTFALLTNTTGSWNVADGTQAMYLHTSGDNNTAIGGTKNSIFPG